MRHTEKTTWEGYIDCPVFTRGAEPASAPCLGCGGCLRCCGCLEALAAKTGGYMGKRPRAKKELWQCPKCGVKTEFEVGHAMVGCEPQPEGRP